MADVLDPYLANEFFVDGFDDYSIKDGLLRCVGYRLQRDHGESIRVAVLRIVMPQSALQMVIHRANSAEPLEEAAPESTRVKMMLS